MQSTFIVVFIFFTMDCFCHFILLLSLKMKKKLTSIKNMINYLNNLLLTNKKYNEKFIMRLLLIIK